jgi:hypothetical protein
MRETITGGASLDRDPNPAGAGLLAREVPLGTVGAHFVREKR